MALTDDATQTDGIRGVFPDREQPVLEELRSWGAKTVTLEDLKAAVA